MVSLKYSSLLALAATLLPLISANTPACTDAETTRGVIIRDTVNRGFWIPDGPGPLHLPTLHSPQYKFPVTGTQPLYVQFGRDVTIDGKDYRVKCYVTGTLAAGVQTITFHFGDGKAYLGRCGAYDGVTVTCGDDTKGNPASDCNGKWPA